MTHPDLSGFQRDVLLTLSRIGPAPGGGIEQVLLSVGYESVSSGRLYPNLNKLIGSGLVEVENHDTTPNEYDLTVQGGVSVSQYRKWVNGND